jgi:tetratricopeptide (TPR) repeat protein
MKEIKMQKRLFLLLVILIGTLLFYFSCEEKGVEKVTAGKLIQQGWAKFEAKNFAGAGSDFSAALSISTIRTDSGGAFLGSGWAELRQNHGGLAQNSLEKFLLLTPGDIDGRAGLAFAYLSQNKFRNAIDTAKVVLSSSASWTFGRDPSINYLDLQLLLAQCYYELADFNTSLAIVKQYFDPSFTANVNTPEGRKKLGDKIESLWTG